MYLRDRIACLVLLAVAIALWVGVVWLVTTLSPVDQPGVRLGGALLIGAAVGATVWPLAWLLAFRVRGRIAYRGSWSVAGRRGALAGLVVAVLIVLRGVGSLGAPLALFVVALAVLVELGFLLRR